MPRTRNAMRSATESAQEIHPKRWAVYRVYPYQAALIELLPTGFGRRQKILAWLDHRVTWPAVCHWVKGRREMPAWARDAIERQLATQEARIASGRAIIASKEKAGSQAGP